MKRILLPFLALLGCSHPSQPPTPKVTNDNIGSYAYIWVVNATDSARTIQMASKELNMLRTLGTVPAHDSVKYLIPMVEVKVDVFVDGWYMESVYFKSIGLYRTEIRKKPNGNTQ